MATPAPPAVSASRATPAEPSRANAGEGADRRDGAPFARTPLRRADGKAPAARQRQVLARARVGRGSRRAARTAAPARARGSPIRPSGTFPPPRGGKRTAL